MNEDVYLSGWTYFSKGACSTGTVASQVGTGRTLLSYMCLGVSGQRSPCQRYILVLLRLPCQ